MGSHKLHTHWQNCLTFKTWKNPGHSTSETEFYGTSDQSTLTPPPQTGTAPQKPGQIGSLRYIQNVRWQINTPGVIDIQEDIKKTGLSYTQNWYCTVYMK